MTIEMEEIGAPFKFSELVDPQQRAHNFLRSRMQIIDLFPCSYGINFNKLSEEKSEKSQQFDISALAPRFNYEREMERYSKICVNYGLDPTMGLRLFLTDETTVTDQINNQFENSFFQGTIDSLKNNLQSISDVGRSVFGDTIDSKMEGKLNEWKANVNSPAYSALVDTAKILLQGKRISLPKIWNTSDYRPAFTAIVKLVSPYGHPHAIKKFIIEPLLYLLILSSPKTTEGVAYGRPFGVTVKAYGITKINLASISSMTVTRGGGDSAFTVFKQPLIVNISLEFTSLIEGIASYDEHDIVPYEKSQIEGVDEVGTLKHNKSSLEISRSLLPTVGDLVNSMKPVNEMPGIIKENEQGGVRDLNLVGGKMGPDPSLSSLIRDTIIEQTPLNEVITVAGDTVKSQLGGVGVSAGLPLVNSLADAVGTAAKKINLDSLNISDGIKGLSAVAFIAPTVVAVYKATTEVVRNSIIPPDTALSKTDDNDNVSIFGAIGGAWTKLTDVVRGNNTGDLPPGSAGDIALTTSDNAVRENNGSSWNEVGGVKGGLVPKNPNTTPTPSNGTTFTSFENDSLYVYNDGEWLHLTDAAFDILGVSEYIKYLTEQLNDDSEVVSTDIKDFVDVINFDLEQSGSFKNMTTTILNSRELQCKAIQTQLDSCQDQGLIIATEVFNLNNKLDIHRDEVEDLAEKQEVINMKTMTSNLQSRVDKYNNDIDTIIDDIEDILLSIVNAISIQSNDIWE